MSKPFRSWAPTGLTIVAAFVFGFASAYRPPVFALPGGNDRYGESITATGSIVVQLDGMKNPVPLDAVYHLDYSGARLLGGVPNVKKTADVTNIVEGFAERDLVADFKLSRDTAPHFQMTTGSLGSQASGLSLLYVFETTSKQVAIYRLTPQSVGLTATPRFDLLQLKSYGLRRDRES